MNDLIFKIPTKDVQIEKRDHHVLIKIKSNEDIEIEFDGNTCIKSNKKMFFISKEEMGFISKNNIHIESINSKLFMNSRQCSIIKNDPESIEYRKQAQIAYEKDKKIAEEQELFTKKLKDRVTDLETELSKLKRELKCLE